MIKNKRAYLLYFSIFNMVFGLTGIIAVLLGFYTAADFLVKVAPFMFICVVTILRLEIWINKPKSLFLKLSQNQSLITLSFWYARIILILSVIIPITYKGNNLHLLIFGFYNFFATYVTMALICGKQAPSLNSFVFSMFNAKVRHAANLVE